MGSRFRECRMGLGVLRGVRKLALDHSAVPNDVGTVCRGTICEGDGMLAHPWRIRWSFAQIQGPAETLEDTIATVVTIAILPMCPEEDE